MRFSLASKHAILALVRLAAAGGGPITVRELAAHGPCPEPYLAKLVPPLVRRGILAATRGRGGGIALARHPDQIPLAEVIRTTDGDAALQGCPFETGPCPGNPTCPLAPVWDPVRDELVSFLERTTIGALAQRVRGDTEAGGDDERDDQ